MNRRWILASVLGLSTACAWAAETDAAPPIRIGNELLVVRLDPGDSSFSVTGKRSGTRFVEQGAFGEGAGRASVGEVQHSTWGLGRAIRVSYDNGGEARLMLFSNLPFVLFDSTLANESDEDVILRSLDPLTLTLEKRAAGLRALGTAGLTGLGRDANPGSYSFLAVADPDTRAGVVAGWLTHDRGSGLLFSDIAEGKARIETRLDYGRLLLSPGGKTRSETLLFGYFDDVRLGLEAYADAISRHYAISLPPPPAVYCTWYHARASNERDLLETARFAREHLTPYGFSVVQIDDGWQAGVKENGPRKDFTTHRSDGPYPSGMRETAQRIKQLGLTPGIWFMPFAGTWDDPFFADKQEMFATKDGKPFEVHWGGTCFDMTHPRTRQYVRSVASRIAREWGYEYCKLDGLWTGMATDIRYVNTGYKDDRLGETRLHDPNKTHVEAYRDGLKIVREAAGEDVFFLGCNVAQNMRTLGASFGLVDAMRVGPDNGRSWDQMCRGPFSGSNLYFLHGRVWYNDPDPIYVRDSVPLEHARALTSWVALTGQLNASSTDYGELSAERLDLLRRSMPAHRLKPRPVDLFEQRIPRIWLLTNPRAGDRSPRRDVIGLFNWDGKQSAQLACPLDRLGLDKGRTYVGFDYWANEFLAPFADVLDANLPPATCRILAVRPVASNPQVVSTSRHITQGMIDLVEEKWDEDSQTLSGISRVVANDPYELRIATMGEAGPWRLSSVTASPGGGQGSVAVAHVWQKDWQSRIVLTTDQTCEISWSVEFATAAPGEMSAATGPEAAEAAVLRTERINSPGG